jgi:hypothetical protein
MLSRITTDAVSDTIEDKYMYDAGSKNIPASEKNFNSKFSLEIRETDGKQIKQP